MYAIRSYYADVLVLDEASYVLPDNHNKAMLLIGPAAIDTGRRYGSKADASRNNFV